MLKIRFLNYNSQQSTTTSGNKRDIPYSWTITEVEYQMAPCQVQDNKLLSTLNTQNELEVVIPGHGFHSHIRGGTYFVPLWALPHYCFRKNCFISSDN